MKGIGTEIGTGTRDGAEGLKEGATRKGTKGTKDGVEAMRKGVGDTKNMADTEDVQE